MKAVIAESFERIHRSNLVGMGVLPLQFVSGQNRESLGLTGNETYRSKTSVMPLRVESMRRCARKPMTDPRRRLR